MQGLSIAPGVAFSVGNKTDGKESGTGSFEIAGTASQPQIDGGIECIVLRRVLLCVCLRLVALSIRTAVIVVVVIVTGCRPSRLPPPGFSGGRYRAPCLPRRRDPLGAASTVPSELSPTPPTFPPRHLHPHPPTFLAHTAPAARNLAHPLSPPSCDCIRANKVASLAQSSVRSTAAETLQGATCVPVHPWRRPAEREHHTRPSLLP